MNHVTVNSHVAESRFDGNQFMGNPPHFFRPAIRLHWKPDRRTDGANAMALTMRDDPARDVVELIAGVLEFKIGDGSRWRVDILPIHPPHEGDLRPGARQQPLDLWPFGTKGRPRNLDKANIVSPRLETDLPQCRGTQNFRRCGRRFAAHAKGPNGRMIAKFRRLHLYIHLLAHWGPCRFPWTAAI